MGFLEGKESGLRQLPTLPALQVHSQSRSWPSAGTGASESLFPPTLGFWREKELLGTKPCGSCCLLWEPVPGHSVIRAKDGAQLRVTTGRPRCIPVLPTPAGLGASLAWVPPGTGLPPYGWSIRSIPMPEGGILTGPVWIGGLTPGWHSPDCDLPAPGTQTLPEAFPCVGLCRATDAWELGGACVRVSGGPQARNAHPRMASADASLGAASCQAKAACCGPGPVHPVPSEISRAPPRGLLTAAPPTLSGPC